MSNRILGNVFNIAVQNVSFYFRANHTFSFSTNEQKPKRHHFTCSSSNLRYMIRCVSRCKTKRHLSDRFRSLPRSRSVGGALRDETQSGCEGDNSLVNLLLVKPLLSFLLSPPPSVFSLSPHFARVQKYGSRLFSAETPRKRRVCSSRRVQETCPRKLEMPLSLCQCRLR